MTWHTDPNISSLIQYSDQFTSIAGYSSRSYKINLQGRCIIIYAHPNIDEPGIQLITHSHEISDYNRQKVKKEHKAYIHEKDYQNGSLIPIKVEDQKEVFPGIIVIFTPGHTSGSICIYLKDSKTLFTGDTIFIDNKGRLKYTSIYSYNVQQLKESLIKLKQFNVETVIPRLSASSCWYYKTKDWHKDIEQLIK